MKLKKKYNHFSTRGLSYFWEFPSHRKKVRRVYYGNMSGMKYFFFGTDWASAIDDVNYFYVPVSRTKKPTKKKLYKPYM